MAYQNPFTPPTLTGYNSSPPSDDGQRTASNALRWATHLSKIGNPLKNFAQALSAAVAAAFDSLVTSLNIPDWQVNRTPAEIAAGVTPTNYSVPSYPVDPDRYYSGDLYASFVSAIAVCNQLTAPHLRSTRSGSLGSNTATFDLPNDSTIELLGALTSSVTSAPCIRFGSTTAQRFGYHIILNSVSRTAVDVSNGSSGVQLRNLASSTIFIRWVVNFETGVFCYGDAGGPEVGFTYCNVHLGLIHDNKTNILLSAANGGYCNENNFYGGTTNHSTSYNGGVFTGTYGLKINHYVTFPLNNNRFYGLSLESNAGAGVGTAASIEGQHNVLFSPRVENPNDTSYPIRFESNSQSCGIVGRGFGVETANIVDAGSRTYYDTAGGRVLIASTPATAGQSVHSARSINTSDAKCYTARDSSGTDTAWFRGTGEAEFLFPTSTTAALEAIGNAINTAGKRAGKVVRNTTSNKLVISQGSAAASTWISVDGATTHTPV